MRSKIAVGLMDSLKSTLGQYDDFILLGSASLHLFKSLQEITKSFYVLESNEEAVQNLQRSQRNVFLVKDVDAALDFFAEELDESKLQNMFVYVNPFCSQSEVTFYRRVEELLTGRSFYSFNLHLHLLGQQVAERFSGPQRRLHLKEGLQILDRTRLSEAEQHLYRILDEVVR